MSRVKNLKVLISIPLLVIAVVFIYFVINRKSSFPNCKYDHAALLTVDGSINKSSTNSNHGTLSILENNWTDGTSFIYTDGIPIHNHYRTKELTKKELEDLHKCIKSPSLFGELTTSAFQYIEMRLFIITN